MFYFYNIIKYLIHFYYFYYLKSIKRKKKVRLGSYRSREGIQQSAQRVVGMDLNEAGMPKKYVNIIGDMYEGASPRVKSLCGDSKDFCVWLGVHQGLVLSTCSL